jgi:hypothetical protein
MSWETSGLGPLLEQVAGPIASFKGDGAYDRDDVYHAVAKHHSEAAGWQKTSGYNRHALAEAVIGRYKRVIGDALCSRTHRLQVTEVAVAANA